MVTRTVTVASFGPSGSFAGKVRYIRWIVVDIGRPEDGADALVVRVPQKVSASRATLPVSVGWCSAAPG